MCSQWPNLGQLNIKIDDNNNILNSIAKIRLHSPHTLSCFSCAQLFLTLWTVAHKAPLSLRLSRQEYWSGLPFPSQGDILDAGIEPRSPALQADSLPSEPPGKVAPFLCPPLVKRMLVDISVWASFMSLLHVTLDWCFVRCFPSFIFHFLPHLFIWCSCYIPS